MRKFSFSMQKIVDLKEKEREQAEWAYGQSLQRKMQEEARLSELTLRRQEAERSLYAIQTGTCHAARLMEIVRYRQAVDRAILTQQRRLFGCAQEVERCQNRLRASMQESKLWQRLKERARESFEEAARQLEQKELDELAAVRFVHRSRSGRGEG